MLKKSLHTYLIFLVLILFVITAIGYLLFPSAMLSIVGGVGTIQTDFLLRTYAVALIAFLPSIWAIRNGADTPVARSILLSLAIYMFLSSAVDLYAYFQGIVNVISIPSVAFRALIGVALLAPLLRSRQ